MIQDLIKEYEKREKELKARVAQDSFDSGFTCGQIEMTQAFLKDLRELEVKEPAQLKTLVLCKRELFFQNSDSKRIHRVYPFTEREAKLLASMLGVEYMHV